MSRTRSVSVCVAIAFAASTAHAAEGMLPNGAELTFERLKIFEGGEFKEASTPDALRLYLNQAHCVCAAAGLGDQQEVEWEMKLSVTTQTSRPASLWVGTTCNDDVQRPNMCRQVNSISDIDTLAAAPAFFKWNLSDLINGINTANTCASGNEKATAWALIDSDGDGTPDYINSKELGAGDVTKIDITPPPMPTNFVAESAEGGVRISWTVPTANMNDIFHYQALCVGPDGAPVKSSPDGPKYQTARTLCDATTDIDLPASDIESDGEAVTLPAELASLDPAYICGTTSEATATGMLIDGLENNTPYKIVLLVVDNYGNVAGTFFTRTVTPQPATDFWEDLHDRGSDVEGGFCLLAETYGTNSPLTNLLRAFRDDTLGPGGALSRAYYATLGKLGGLVHGSLALRIIAAVVLFPLVVIALAWHFLTLPGLFALIALAYLWRKRRLLVLASAAPAALAALVLFAPSAARAQAPSPYWDGTNNDDTTEVDDKDLVRWHVGVRVGPYTPDIDSQFGMTPGPYADMFGGARYTPMIDIDRILWTGFGQLGVGGSIGYMQKTANAWADGSTPGDPMRMRSPGDENTFRLLPLALTATYRLTWFDDEYGVPIVPYVRGGLAYYMWWVRSNGKTAAACWDGTHTQGCDADDALGASLGVVGSIGIAIRAERIDAAAASSMKQGGIQHAGFYGELSLAKVDGFGSGTKLSVGDATWFAGVDFEF